MNTRFAFLLFGMVATSTLGLTALAASQLSGSDSFAIDATVVAAADAGSAPAAAELQRSLIERGRYIVSYAMCDDCHTPKKMGPNGPEMDFSRRLSGHPEGSDLPPAPALPEGTPWVAVAAWDLTAWNGPWGTSFAANLTPDQNTGIGIWTEDMFIRSIRTGRHMGQSRPILPPMPWEVIRNMNDDDLKAVFAFLQSLPPIHNRIPEPLPPPGQQEQDPFTAAR